MSDVMTETSEKVEGNTPESIDAKLDAPSTEPTEKTETQSTNEDKPEAKGELDKKDEADSPESKKTLKFTKRPRKQSRAVQQKLHEQSLEIAVLRDQNREIIESLKNLGKSGNAPTKTVTETAKAKAAVTPHEKQIIEKWTADLEDAKENAPEVFTTIEKIQKGRHPISYLDTKTQETLLSDDGLSPFDLHDLSVNFKDEMEELIEKNLSSRGELRQIRKWLDEQEIGKSDTGTKAVRKVAPKPTGVLKGKPEMTQKQTSEQKVKKFHEAAGLL